MTKSLLDQWQEDCERLTKPHLQWKIMHPTRCSDYIPASYEQCELLIGIKSFEGCFRRIESLALPFDLEDAVNGGKVEWSQYMGEWVDCKFISVDNDGIVKIVESINCSTHFDSVNFKYLRMKESRLKTTGEKHHD